MLKARRPTNKEIKHRKKARRLRGSRYLHCSPADVRDLESLLIAADDHKYAFSQKLFGERTRAEIILWKAWRAYPGAGVGQQMPIAGFIADFYLPQSRLVVELDGFVHDRRKEYDQRRNELLASKGIETIRFDNKQVLDDPRTVLSAIQAKHNQILKQKAAMVKNALNA